MRYYLCIILILVSLSAQALEDKKDIEEEIKKEVKLEVEKKKSKNKNNKSTRSNNSESSSSESNAADSTATKSTEVTDTGNSNMDIISGYLSKVFIPTKVDSSLVLRDMVILSSRYNFQYWKPTFIRGTIISTTILSYSEFDLYFYKRLYHLKYEKSLGGSSVNQQNDLLNKRKKESWEKLVADITIPIYLDFYFSYVQEAFTGTVTAQEDKTYVSEHYDPDAEDISSFEFLQGEKINFETNFKDYLLGVQAADSTFTAIGGLFYTRYEKPYSLTLDSEQNTKYIFDSRFNGGGIFLKLHLFNSRTSFSINGKYGLGSINLLGINHHIGSNIEHSHLGYLDIDSKLLMTKTIFKGYLSLHGGLDIRYRRFDLFFTDGDDEDSETDSIFLNSDTIYNIKFGISINF